jgi:hypothetical protein
VFTYSVSPALIGSDIFSGLLTREEGEDVDNDYTIRIGTLNAGDNYTITLDSVDFAITPKPVTVTPITNQGKVYGETDPAFTFSVSPALIGSDALSGTLILQQAKILGTYAFSIGTLDAGSNYTVTFADADFTISPMPITITPDKLSKEYGNSDPNLTYTSTPSLLGSEKIIGNIGREAGENAGTYSIS